MNDWPTWRSAWGSALYGPGGFYFRPEGPAGHFRTAAHACAPDLASALLRLAGSYDCRSIVDVGAGRGELLMALSHSAPGSFTLHGVDVVPRPDGLPDRIGWSNEIDRIPADVWRAALVMGWELLDVVPCSVLELDSGLDLRQVLVDPVSGREKLGPVCDAEDLSWCQDWWPLGDLQEGDRVEAGVARDSLWSSLVACASAGRARAVMAVDYGHRRETRPRLGSLTGFYGGRAVPPRPDGSMDITAHVAMDAVAAAGIRAGTVTSILTTQALALTELGLRSEELLDPGGLGGFDWLFQTLA